MADPYNPTANLLAKAGLTGAVDGAPVAGSSGYVFMGPDFAGQVSPSMGSTANSQIPQGAREHLASDASLVQTKWGIEKARAYYAFMDPLQKNQVEEYAKWKAGGYGYQPDQTVEARWNDALTATEYINRISGTTMTPYEWMRMQIASRVPPGGSSGGGSGGGGGGGGGPSTSVSVTLSSQSDAEAIVDQALTQYLGREADNGERDNFWKLLNRAQSKKPNVTTTTPGASVTSSVSSGGVNAQQAGKEFALSQNDAAEYMANTDYMDWLVEKIAKDPTEGIASGL